MFFFFYYSREIDGIVINNTRHHTICPVVGRTCVYIITYLLLTGGAGRSHQGDEGVTYPLLASFISVCFIYHNRPKTQIVRCIVVKYKIPQNNCWFWWQIILSKEFSNHFRIVQCTWKKVEENKMLLSPISVGIFSLVVIVV